MCTSQSFDDLPVLGKLSRAEAAKALREVGEAEAADKLLAQQPAANTRTFSVRDVWPFRDRPWQHTAHAFGYLAPAPPGNDLLPIHHAGNINADESLKKARLKITLNCLRVADYPGRGTHHILFDFYAQNQVAGGNVEHLHFNATYRVREGERAGIAGYPIFIGLNVGSEGVAFKCFTVNVRNDEDQSFLASLDSDVFKAGLKLATTLQPAIGPLSGMAVALTRSIARRNQNVPVQDFYLGLDFTSVGTGARLAEGSYLAVQIPEALWSAWDWTDWVFNPAKGQVVNKHDQTQMIPYNYLIFAVSRYEG